MGEPGAYELLEQIRWGGAPESCPLCRTPGRCRLLRPRAADPDVRRVWKCGACRRQFSVLTGTVLGGTRLPVRVWLAALRDWAAEGRPTARSLSVTPEAARQLLRRVDAGLAGARDCDPLTAVLALSAGEAAAVRCRTPARIRPRRQIGPTADYA